ncbi:inner membrane-spanning protein YciB [Candidatus Ichthyocystis hellenicum]|uniref:inner membrane-spanning protein YciB n=1 Tax=Candidatus Ichthyocystis hellenicum TaxID=1561003 RepID=UPI000B85F86C|nr:septation protein IspZ [Candidatus Ichthyocystis hellenicum]
MRSLLNIFPLLVFVAVYIWKGIYWATSSLVVSQLLHIIACKFLSYKIDLYSKVTFFLAVILGGMTLLFHDARFIQTKPTIIYWLASLVFCVAHYKNKNIPELLLKDKIDFKVSAAAWNKVSIAWIVSFFLLGIINIYVAFSFSVNVWFYFKFYFVSAFLLLFSIIQVTYLWKSRLPMENSDDTR